MACALRYASVNCADAGWQDLRRLRRTDIRPWGAQLEIAIDSAERRWNPVDKALRRRCAA